MLSSKKKITSLDSCVSIDMESPKICQVYSIDTLTFYYIQIHLQSTYRVVVSITMYEYGM